MRPERNNHNPHNVFDNTVVVNFQIIQDSGNKHHNKTFGLGLGIASPFFVCVVLVSFGWLSFEKWRGLHKEKNLKVELVTGPRQFRNKELRSAIGGFHSSWIIEDSTLGTVYKAFFMDLSAIVVMI